MLIIQLLDNLTTGYRETESLLRIARNKPMTEAAKRKLGQQVSEKCTVLYQTASQLVHKLRLKTEVLSFEDLEAVIQDARRSVGLSTLDLSEYASPAAGSTPDYRDVELCGNTTPLRLSFQIRVF